MGVHAMQSVRLGSVRTRARCLREPEPIGAVVGKIGAEEVHEVLHLEPLCHLEGSAQQAAQALDETQALSSGPPMPFAAVERDCCRSRRNGIRVLVDDWDQADVGSELEQLASQLGIWIDRSAFRMKEPERRDAAHAPRIRAVAEVLLRFREPFSVGLFELRGRSQQPRTQVEVSPARAAAALFERHAVQVERHLHVLFDPEAAPVRIGEEQRCVRSYGSAKAVQAQRAQHADAVNLLGGAGIRLVHHQGGGQHGGRITAEQLKVLQELASRVARRCRA